MIPAETIAGNPAPAGDVFERIAPGQCASISKVITEREIAAFAAFSGDYNPLHVDREFARSTSFQRPVAHGMIVASLVSTLIGMQLPGSGALWMQQTFRWGAPVFAGDRVDVTLTVVHKSAGARTVMVEVKAVNQNGKSVMEGEGSVMLLERHERPRDRALAERVALVTGGARGIGAAISMALAEAGASVAVNYRQGREQAEALCSAIAERGGNALAVGADVTSADQVQTAVASAAERFGRPVDLLVNNAGLPVVPRPFLDLPWPEVQELLDVQVKGAFTCAQAVLPGMVAAKSGRIVNIGSVLTRGVPPAQWTAFVLAKAALASLTRSLAVEFGPQGIQVNLISPGLTETESTASIPERLRKVQAMQTPLRRLARAEDIAKAVLFLCSEGGQFVTGADIPVCGGSSM